MDKDIDALLNNQPLKMGDKVIPEFDEYKVYQNLMHEIKQRNKRNFYSIAKWACAILLLLFNISYFSYDYYQSMHPVFREIATCKGEHMVVLLPDGSRVWLNADSKLKYPEQFTAYERRVVLEGEAYFEVKKDSKHPFIVRADEMKIRVLGTCFNVSAYESDKEIITTLDEGKIAIGHCGSKSSQYTMLPGQTATYEKGSSKCTIQSDEYYQDASSWRNNKLTFRNEPLEDVLKVLSRQFNVNFQIKSTRITSFTYNFDCKGNDLNDILETMAAITPITFKKIDENNYEII